MNLAQRHDTAFALLPWLVNGTLVGEERTLVERHLKECVSCRAELKSQRHLASLVETHPTVHISPDQGFENLLPRLERREPRLARQTWAAAVAALATPPRLGSAFGVLVAAALLALFAGSALDLQGVGYRTLTGTISPSAAPRIDVVLSPGHSDSDARALAVAIGGRVVGGPSTVGRYTIALDDDARADDLSSILDRLRQDPRVRFAGPALMPAPQTP